MRLILETRDEITTVSANVNDIPGMIESFIELLLARGYEPDKIFDALQKYSEKVFKDLKK